MYGLVILLHVLGASVWVGGHLVLALSVLPRAMKARDPAMVLSFEQAFERVGMPALALQVLTGLWLAPRYLPALTEWFTLRGRVPALIAAKVALLVVTLALAADARWRVIPRLRPETLSSLAWHIVLVTLCAVAFAAVGVSVRTGWL